MRARRPPRKKPTTTERAFKFVLQEPEGCGQACVAMLLGVSFSKACALVGHNKGTTSPELIQVLDAKYVCHPTKKGAPTSGLAILGVSWYLPGNKRKEEIGHWQVFDNGTVLDPYYGRNPLLRNGKVTSHIPLEKR